jgi:hypothetical protein
VFFPSPRSCSFGAGHAGAAGRGPSPFAGESIVVETRTKPPAFTGAGEDDTVVVKDASDSGDEGSPPRASPQAPPSSGVPEDASRDRLGLGHLIFNPLYSRTPEG